MSKRDLLKAIIEAVLHWPTLKDWEKDRWLDNLEYIWNELEK